MRYSTFLFAAILTFAALEGCGQEKKEPWAAKQLVETDSLATRIAAAEVDDLLILSIGPDAIIKGSVDIGPAGEGVHLKKLQTFLKTVPRDKEVIIYCGCCPFDRCPNVRPAFTLLNDMGFEKGKLLNVRQNIKVDWLDKDYPINE